MKIKTSFSENSFVDDSHSLQMYLYLICVFRPLSYSKINMEEALDCVVKQVKIEESDSKSDSSPLSDDIQGDIVTRVQSVTNKRIKSNHIGMNEEVPTIEDHGLVYKVDFRKEIEYIKYHLFRKDGVRLRVKWKNYKIETTENLKDLLKFESSLKNYIDGLSKRAKSTILKRAPGLARLFNE